MSYSPYAPPQYPQGPYGGGPDGGGGYYGPVYRYQPLGWKTTAAAVGMVATVILQFAQTGAAVAMGDVFKHPQPGDLGAFAAVGLISMASGIVAICTYIF